MIGNGKVNGDLGNTAVKNMVIMAGNKRRLADWHIGKLYKYPEV